MGLCVQYMCTYVRACVYVWHAKDGVIGSYATILYAFALLPMELLIASWHFSIPKVNSWRSGRILWPRWKKTNEYSKSPVA